MLRESHLAFQDMLGCGRRSSVGRGRTMVQHPSNKILEIIWNDSNLRMVLAVCLGFAEGELREIIGVEGCGFEKGRGDFGRGVCQNKKGEESSSLFLFERVLVCID